MRVSLDRMTMVGLECILALWFSVVVDRLATMDAGRADRSAALEELALDLTRTVTAAEIAHAQRSDDRVDDNLGIGHDVVERLGRGRQ